MSAAEWGLSLAAVVLAGIAAGSLVTVHFAVLPVIERLPPDVGVTVHRLSHGFVHRFIPPSIALAALCGLGLFAADPDLGRATPAAALAGGLAAVAVIVVSQLGGVPLARRIHGYPPEAVPAEFPQVLRRWGNFDLVRTAFAVAALACFAVAALER